MNPTHLRLQNVARRLIEKNGRKLSLGKTTATGGRRPGDRRGGEERAVEQVGVGVVTTFAVEDVDGDRVLETDVQILFTADVTPVRGMTVFDGEDGEYRIENVATEKPGEVVIMHTVHAR